MLPGLCVACATVSAGSEALALTQKQADRLEVVHSACLWPIVNVRRTERHNKQHLWSQCSTVSLAAHLTAHRLRWLGHVLRMGEERYPHQAMSSLMHDAGAAHPGAPRVSWEKCVTQDLTALQLPTSMHELKGVCELRGAWRGMLYKLTHPDAVRVPARRSGAAPQLRHMQQRAERLQPRARCTGRLWAQGSVRLS